MRPSWGVIGWLPVVLLTACAASQTGEPPALRPAPERLLTAGDIHVAAAHLQAFGVDPGPVDGLFTAQTQAAVRPSRPDMACRCRDGSIARCVKSCNWGWTPSGGASHEWWHVGILS